MRILIAEDDTEMAEFIERGLVELGHDVVNTDNGADALRLLLSEQFDIAVVDRMLPRLDGLTALRRARAGQVDTPVLLLTALGGIEEMRVDEAVHRQKSAIDRDRRKREDDHDRHDELRPDEERNPIQRHSRCALLEDRDDDLSSADQAGDFRERDGLRPDVDALARRELGTR